MSEVLDSIEFVEPAEDETAEERRPSGRRVLRRVLLGLAGAVAVLVLAGALLYGFGTMQPASAEARAAYGSLVAAGTQPAVEARFRVPIPGCVCHSSDPVQQAQHEYLYLRECGSCH